MGQSAWTGRLRPHRKHGRGVRVRQLRQIGLPEAIRWQDLISPQTEQIAEGAQRARRAGLAAGTAVGHACGGPTPAAASAAVLKHLLVLGVTGRADPALVAPGVDALELARF
jgi:hypothetical protein